MFGADAVDAAKTLDETHGVPVQVVVDDVVAVLQVEALGEDVGGDQGVDFRQSGQRELGIRFGRKTGDDLGFAFVAAVDDVYLTCPRGRGQ